MRRPWSFTAWVVAVLGLLVLALGVAACGGDESGPPEIVLGRTECDECHMIVDDLRFAGAYRLEDGTETRFDDVGDMLTHSSDELDGAEVWVWDYKSTEPLMAPDATFVVSPGLVTPMAWGIAAFAQRSDAEALADELGGEIADWEELQRLVAAGEIGGHVDRRGVSDG